MSLKAKIYLKILRGFKRMLATPCERAFVALRFVDLAEGCSQVQDSPVQVSWLPAGEYLAGEALQVGVVANIY